jgi:hypothetical protein
MISSATGFCIRRGERVDYNVILRMQLWDIQYLVDDAECIE